MTALLGRADKQWAATNADAEINRPVVWMKSPNAPLVRRQAFGQYIEKRSDGYQKSSLSAFPLRCSPLAS